MQWIFDTLRYIDPDIPIFISIFIGCLDHTVSPIIPYFVLGCDHLLDSITMKCEFSLEMENTDCASKNFVLIGASMLLWF